MGQSKRFQHVVIAGTFDHLHLGHRYLIDQAFLLGEKVSIGLTTDKFIVQKKFSQAIESYAHRLQNLKRYISSQNHLRLTHFFPIEDIYGPAGTDSTLQAIIVTRQSYTNAKKVNAYRAKNGLKPLHIITLHLKKGSDNQTISSTRVRGGETDRSGWVFRHVYKKTSKLRLPDTLRTALRQPAGDVIPGDEAHLEKAAQKIKDVIHKSKPVMVIAVGDVVAQSLDQVGYTPDITVIDFKTRRHKMQNWKKFDHTPAFINSQGTVSKTASEAIRRAISQAIEHKNKKIIVIKGEEDLLTAAAILHAPLGADVVYGQHDLGVIIVKITEAKKQFIANLLKKFSS